MNDKFPTMAMLESEYNRLKNEKLRFENVFYSDVSSISNRLDSFLAKCNQKLAEDKRLRLSGKLRLFKYIEFAQQFGTAILPVMQASKKAELQSVPPVFSLSPPVRSPEYRGRSKLVAFAELLGLSLDQTVYKSRFYDIKKINPPSYSDPQILKNLAKLQEGGINVIKK